MIGQLGWTNFPSYISNLPFLLISLSHSPPTFSSATGFVRCSVGGKRIIICYCELLRCPKMNFWISNLLIQFYVFMASSAKEIYLVMDWRKATPLVTNRTLVVRFHDHFFSTHEFQDCWKSCFSCNRIKHTGPPFYNNWPKHHLYCSTDIAVLLSNFFVQSQLFAFDTAKKFLTPKAHESPKTFLPPSLVAGAIAGVSSTLCMYPLELIKTRLTIEVKRALSQQLE